MLSWKVGCYFCTWHLIIHDQTFDEILKQIASVRNEVQKWIEDDEET